MEMMCAAQPVQGYNVLLLPVEIEMINKNCCVVQLKGKQIYLFIASSFCFLQYCALSGSLKNIMGTLGKATSPH